VQIRLGRIKLRLNILIPILTIYIISCEVDPDQKQKEDCFDSDCPIVTTVYQYENNPTYELDYLGCDDIDTMNIEFIDMDSAYTSCDGNQFYGECNQDSCIDTKLERQVFDIWKMKFKSIYTINDQFFDDYIELHEVSIHDGPLYVWCRIEYIYKTSWLRSRQVISIKLGEHPLIEEPDVSEIERLAEVYINEQDEITEYDIITLKQMLYLSKREINCVEMNYKFCTIDFWFADTLSIRGYGAVDLSANECIESKINLITGEIQYKFAPCFITN